jgi:hypothetical protein
MTWPSPQDYNEAVQNPAQSFDDVELKAGSPELDRFGLPRPTSGAFACVYRFKCPKGKEWAVRCFLHPVTDQSQRYAELREKLATLRGGKYIVDFDFLDRGIRVHNTWYPILKMEWVDGLTINNFVDTQVFDREAMQTLGENFKDMIRFLKENGITHGDLQHGNIMVVKNELKLVDYDCMFVEGMPEFTIPELGHRNYQHPSRNAQHNGAYLDNFSAWTIHTALNCLSAAPAVWNQLGAGDESMLFRHEDFLHPSLSPTFSVLEHHGSPEALLHSRRLRYLSGLPIEKIPSLDETVEVPADMDEIPPPNLLPKPRGHEHWLTTWLTQDEDGDRVVIAFSDSGGYNHQLERGFESPHYKQPELTTEQPRLKVSTALGAAASLPAVVHRPQSGSHRPASGATTYSTTGAPLSGHRVSNISTIAQRHNWSSPPTSTLETIIKFLFSTFVFSLAATVTIATVLILTYAISKDFREALNGQNLFANQNPGYMEPPTTPLPAEPNEPETKSSQYYYLGYDAMYNKQYKQAVDLFQTSLKEFESEPPVSEEDRDLPSSAASSMGESYEALGNYKAAKVAYQKALDLRAKGYWSEQDRARDLCHLGRVNMLMGDWKGARVTLERVRSLLQKGDLSAEGDGVFASAMRDLEAVYRQLKQPSLANQVHKFYVERFVMNQPVESAPTPVSEAAAETDNEDAISKP